MINGSLWSQGDFTTVRNASDKTKKAYKEAYSLLVANDLVKAEKKLWSKCYPS